MIQQRQEQQTFALSSKRFPSEMKIHRKGFQ